MVETKRKRAQEPDNGNSNNENIIINNNKKNNNNNNNNKNTLLKGSERGEYERVREKRIKENMEKMQKLGILDSSLKLKADVFAPPKPNVSSSDKPHIPLPVFEPSRRSSRLKTLAPVSYSDKWEKEKGKSSKNKEIRVWQSQPEIYTEEHEKLLGDCKTTWTLFVDGYDKDGKRMYYQVKGEICHQCRWKKIGLHTHCSKCNLDRGKFCGDCLYMRYGENVIEANQNPNWICPVCRGICNCSLCRHAKGWRATGALYRKVIGLGFKSVAHFLIQTRRSQPNSEDSGAKSFSSAEISLPSAGTKSQPSSCNESLYAAEDHEDEIEEEKRKCSFLDSKYVDMDGGCKKDYDNDDTIDNNVGLKEKEVDMDEQEVISSEL